LAGEQEKKGTPTMGGLIIIVAIVVPTLLLADVSKVYILLMLFATVWMGLIGFIDDYLKIRAKRLAQQQGINYKKGDKDGLAGWFKILGQVVLGVAVATTLMFNDSVSAYREFTGTRLPANAEVKKPKLNGKEKIFIKADEPVTTIPFVKSHEFNYAKLLPKAIRGITWLLYVLIVVFIVTAVSNGANITDGIDGLATGVSAVIGIGLGIFAYASGDIRFADYLNILYIPGIGELSIFIAALVGACIGFFMVQLISCTGVYGRYRKFNAGRSDCIAGVFSKKRIIDSDILCCVFSGSVECYVAGELLQIHQKEVW
jgi:phospho-N-acetylmuramoyl-pentapeptide-transferase